MKTFLERSLDHCLDHSRRRRSCRHEYYHDKYQALKVNPNAEAQKQPLTWFLAVGKLMELPQGETPTVAYHLRRYQARRSDLLQISQERRRVIGLYRGNGSRHISS